MAGNDITNRRLAAILAADVVGYSRMMGADETGTLAALRHHRETLFDPAVADHRGRVFKLIGDGTLVEFASAVDAVNCALAIQRAARAEDGGIVLRIGVNLGDVIMEGDDVYGDGVNVAARLEPLAKPGGICIASIVNESVGNRIAVSFRDGGEVSVKNIARPIRVWQWHPDLETANGPTAEPARPSSPSPPPRREQPSIAVLPFDNMSGDPEQEYFADGLTEDIITDLSKVSGLLVIARNSSFAYKGRSVDIRTVGRELGVRTVLEGSIRRAGNRIRVTAQLIDVATGGHAWAERFDRDLTDIFEVQDEVTCRIVDALKLHLSPGEAERIAEAPTRSVEARDLYMKGRALGLSPNINAASYAQAVDLFERAIALDPGYAQAYGALSSTLILDFHNRWSDDPDRSLSLAEELAEKAIAADPKDSFAHYAAGVAAMHRSGPEQAAPHIERALKLNPNDPFALNARGAQAIYQGRPQDAIADLERAMQIDPVFGQQYLQFLGLAHLMLGHNETAAAMFRERILLVPHTDVSRCTLAAALGHLGEIDEARKVWAELIATNPDYRLDGHMARLPFANQADKDRIVGGLAKAGLP